MRIYTKKGTEGNSALESHVYTNGSLLSNRNEDRKGFLLRMEQVKKIANFLKKSCVV